MGVFGRSKSDLVTSRGRETVPDPSARSEASTAGATVEAGPGDATTRGARNGGQSKQAGKGRPTPRRREAESRNRRPLVAPPLDKNASKEERKRAKVERRRAAREHRALVQQAYVTGDDRHLPQRDRGPVRRFARDHVDARRSVGEYFLPLALPLVLLYAAPSPLIRFAAILLLYGLLILVAVDSVLLRRKLNRLLAAKFGADKIAGTATYGMMRSWQIRRSRLPRPQVKRGEYPH